MMDAHIESLTDDARRVLALTQDERISYIREQGWIGYPQAKLALSKMTELFDYPQTYRMPNLLIAGPTNNGKTTILRRFIKNQRPPREIIDGRLNVPVLMVGSPATPNEGRLYDKILMTLGAPFRVTDPIPRKQMLVLKLFRDAKIRLLILDDIHNILAGTTTQQRVFLNVLREMSTELMIPMIAAGTLEAFNAISSDPQLQNRFEPLPLPPWKLNSDYQRLLASFEKRLPLRSPSQLHQPEIANRIHAMAKGTIGGTDTVIKKAAVVAIRQGLESVTPKIIKSLEAEALTATKAAAALSGAH